MQLPRRTRTTPTKLPPVDSAMQTEHEDIARVLNRNVSFGVAGVADNINGAWATVADTGLANTDFTVTHKLGRIPEGFLVINASVATDVFQGSVAWTTTQITLRSSTAHAKLTLFVL